MRRRLFLRIFDGRVCIVTAHHCIDDVDVH
jgi:hypothetical protein